MEPIKLSLAARFLTRLANAVYRHRRWFFYPQAALFLICGLFTVRSLEFATNRNALVGGEKEYHKIFLEYKNEFPVQDDLVVVVESENLERNRQFVERLGAKIERETNVFASVLFKFDFKNMGPKALLFLPEDDLKALKQTFAEYQPVLRQFTRATNLVSLIDLVNTQFRTASPENDEANAALIQALPALVRIITQATDALRRLGAPPSPGISALFEGSQEEERQMYLTFHEGKVFLLTAQAHNELLNELAVERLRQLIAETQLEVPGLNVGLTGEPVLELDEMLQSQKDTTVASIVAFVLVALIFIYGYHETGRPLKATACLLFGIAYTMGYTTLVIGHLNILTITFVPILVGLAIDFGVHLVTRYEEELWHGRPEKPAMERAMVFTGMGIFTGALTTAAAFFAMAGTSFKGIQEMGIICGGGLLLSLIPMMTLLPVLLLRGKQNVLDHELAPVLDHRATVENTQRARIEKIWLDRPGAVLVVVGVLSAACIYPATRVKFDYNLLHMQSAGLPAVIFQHKLITSSSRSLLSAAVVATNLTEAETWMTRLTNLPSVASVESMVPLLAEDQSQKLILIQDIKRIVTAIPFQPVDTNQVSVTALKQSLFSFDGYVRLARHELQRDIARLEAKLPSSESTNRPPESAGSSPAATTTTNELAQIRKDLQLEQRINGELEKLRTVIVQLQMDLLRGDPMEIAEKLAEFQQALFNDVTETFSAFRHQDASGPMRVQDLPPALRQRFIGINGKYLLLVFPKHDIWERHAQEEFVRQLRTVDRRVTGTPVQLLEYTTLLKDSFEEAALYSLLAITIMVLIHFRRISCVGLALLPVAVGSLWMVGIMGTFGIPFNPANIMTLPLVIGVGVTNGIHILNRFAEEQHPAILARSTGKAVLVSGLTTIAGFGSLILAQHRGIESLGLIMSIGTATCMVIALTFLPAILNLLNRGGWTIKRPSATCTINTGSGGTEVNASSMQKN